jgi:hypothetical protein
MSNETAVRQLWFARLRIEANQLHAAMKVITENEVDWVNVYNAVIKDDMAWEQLMIDLETLAGLAKIEE